MNRTNLIRVASLLALGCLQSHGEAIAQAADSWTIPLLVQIDNNKFNLYIGVRPNATAGFDVDIDTIAPPPPFTPYAVFSIPVFPNTLQADFRGSDQSIAWSLRLLNTAGATSNISWNVTQLPSSRRLFLNDTLDMSKRNVMTLVGDQTVKISSIVVSVKSTPFDNLPEAFNLTNYPNPFSSTTMLEVNLPASRPVVVSIFNLVGQEIRTFVQNHPAPGLLKIQWDGRDAAGASVPNGVYFCRLEVRGARGILLWRKLYRVR